MRRNDGILKQIAIVFLIALGLYILSFSWIEGKRSHKGPWQVTFQTDAQGQPSVIVAQPALNISNVTFQFPDERILPTNLLQRIVFDSPTTNVPFGKVIYFDTTFLPGAVTLELFRHEIEFLPRTLVLNGKEVPWRPQDVFELRRPTATPPPKGN